MARVFIYQHSKLSFAQIKDAVESLPKRRRVEHGRGWVIGRPGEEARVYPVPEPELQRHNAEKVEVRRALGLMNVIQRRINTALLVYVQDQPLPLITDLLAPVQLLADQTVLEQAQTLAHRLKAHGLVVIDDTDSGGGISRIRPSDHTRL